MIKSIVTVASLFFLIPGALFAATTSDFSIRTLIGEDLEPPTTPTLLSVLPVAQTQIDVTWSVATDDFLLEGYVLIRDGLPLATTTLTTFIDSSLTPNTLYSYEVYAFDSAGNISTTSNALSTTTLAVPVVPPASTSTIDSGPTYGTLVFRLQNSTIIPSTNSALFKWETSMPSRFSLRWGRNDVFDGGYIVSEVYRKENQTLVSGLEPGTVYFYELIGYSSNGAAVELKKGSFKTDSRAGLVTPNVQNLRAEVAQNNVTLSWVLPVLAEGAVVRVVRSHLYYPTDIYDGAVVYEGKDGLFFDAGALQNYETLYYSVFVIAADGSISSGAVVQAKKRAVSTSPPPEEILPPEEEPVLLPDFNFSVENIILTQGNKNFSFKSEKIELSAQDYFVISIPYESLPKHLKSIIVTLLDPLDQKRSYSFLLRINKDRTAYEAVIAPLEAVGVSRLQVEIFDYERHVIARYRKQIDFVSNHNATGEVIFPDKIVKMFAPLFFWIVLGLLFLIALFFYFRRRSNKAEDKL